MRLRAILSKRVAQALIDEGERVIKIEPSERLPGKLVFIFEDNQAVKKALDEAKATRPPM